MAAPDVTKVQGAAGILILNPTSLAAGVLVGGTELGLASDVILRPLQRSFLNTAEEYGGKTVEEYDMGRDWICAMLIRGFDDDLLSFIFPNTAGAPGVTVTETLSESGGKALSARSGVILFKPNDLTHHGFILRRALPRVRESSRMPWSVHERTSFAAIFRAIPNTGGADIAVGPYAKLTIP